MKFEKTFIFTITTLIILPSLSIIIVADPTPLNSRATATKDWTFMVYMAGDNSLGAYEARDMVKADLAEMQSGGGSDSNINIICLVDKYLWYNSICYYVTSSDLTVIPLSTVGFSSSELNMGDPNTVTTFVNWAISNYPAEKYFLDMWDHGSGWIHSCSDDTQSDELTAAEVGSALRSIRVRNGRLDVIGWDACYMANNEILYQIKNEADYFVGSQHREAFNGWDYDATISWLTSNPTCTPAQLSSRIVDDYDNYYSTAYTLSAINLKDYDLNVTDNLNMLLQALKHRGNTYTTGINFANTYTLFYRKRAGSQTLCDLYDFAENTRTSIANSTIQGYCTAVKNGITNCVINEKHSSDLSDSHGLTFYFPSSPAYFDYSFFSLKWHRDSAHYEFLKNYWGVDNRIVARAIQPTIETVGTTCYVNGTGAQAKIDRGDWRTGEISVSTGTHTVYGRLLDSNDEWSVTNSSVISGISRVITPSSGTAFSISLTQGWNLLSSPASSEYTAKTWCMELGAKEIIRKNLVSKGYDEYVYDYSSDAKNYQIEPPKGYFVYHENGTTYVYQSLEQRPVSLQADSNLVGIAEDITASQIILKSDSIKSVTKRNDDGSYSTYTSAVPVGDFTINRGFACFIFTSNPQAIRI